MTNATNAVANLLDTPADERTLVTITGQGGGRLDAVIMRNGLTVTLMAFGDVIEGGVMLSHTHDTADTERDAECMQGLLNMLSNAALQFGAADCTIERQARVDGAWVGIEPTPDTDAMPVPMPPAPRPAAPPSSWAV